MEMERERRNPKVIFMAFGTKGDVYPIAAICAAFASDQTQYSTFLITHSAHENLSYHLEQSRVTFVPIKSPAVLAVPINQNYVSTAKDSDFELKKRNIAREHRQECLLAVERIFGHGHTMDGDFIVINFFALEGWSLAELFCVRCVVAAPYVVPYSAPLSFERQFRKELQLLYKHLLETPTNKVCWKDVIHWMWPLFTEIWGSWRSKDLNLSPLPFTDPITGLPSCHNWPPSPLLLYGFSKEVVEVPDYWPSNVQVCGFWFLPYKWQFSCQKCCQTLSYMSSGSMETKEEICLTHEKLRSFLKGTVSGPPIFIGLSSIGRQVTKFLKLIMQHYSHCEADFFAL